MNIPLQSATTWKAVVTVLQILSILGTAARLEFRRRRQTIWMDDLTVILPLVMELIGVIVLWFIYNQPGHTSAGKSRVALYWLASISWITVLWFTRISLILSITRIFPDWGTIRRNCRGIAVAFGIFYVGFICWLCTSPCVPSETATPSDILDCSNERHFLAIASFACDVFACSLLVAYPGFILLLVPLSRGQYKLVISLLFGCLSIFLCCAIYGTFAYSPSVHGAGQPFVTGMLAQIEAGLSLLSCNIVAFVTYVYRNDSSPDAIDDRIDWRKAKADGPELNPLRPSKGVPMRMIHSQDRETSSGESGQRQSHDSISKAGVRFSTLS